uniref:RNA-directed RNA polymerase n=1 Tax=Leviviridae sp. TaxID=2027243 RepID=A0A514CZJ2_9VIRU|nr:MAG: RNA-dependent RNA polymerase [Leviviridae sp.]
MKSPMLLWKSIAEESAIQCCTSATRDINYVSRRYEYEGLSFLTITLPSFGKDFQKSLDQGYVDRSLFQGFPWQVGLPRFLGGFLDLVFDRTSGQLRNTELSVVAILAIRQLTLMFSKILLPCSDARVKDAIEAFVSCEQDVKVSNRKISSHDWNDFERIGNLLFGSLFSEIDRKIYYGDLLPKHGPGATADRLRANAKYRQASWPARLEGVFPFGEYALPNWRYFDEMSNVDILEPGSETPARVVTVPKTLKAPRVIAIEPTAMQYMQQAISRPLVEAIENDKVLTRLIGFRDQIPNQEMARIGSLKGNLATLDLSEASDRVSNQHVRHLVSQFPHLHKGLDATRSRKADIPGHGVKRLAKYASMGSALCFPLEALVFTTLIFLGIERASNSPLTRSTFKRYLGSVRVYGDDIIVPVHCAESVIDVLESFGIKVNRDKSFWNGKFRESCGKEYYDGQDVSIVKVRRESPNSRMRFGGLNSGDNVDRVNSYVDLRNQLYFAGYWRTCERMDVYIRDLITYFPVVAPTSPLVGRYSFLGYSQERMHPSLHSPLVKGWQRAAVLPKDSLDGYAALLKCLLLLEEKATDKTQPVFPFEHSDPIPIEEAGGLPAVNAEHLERAGRPHAVTLKLRWASPF